MRGRGPAGRGGAIIHPTLAAPAPEELVRAVDGVLLWGLRPPPQTRSCTLGVCGHLPTTRPYSKVPSKPRGFSEWTLSSSYETNRSLAVGGMIEDMPPTHQCGPVSLAH